MELASVLSKKEHIQKLPVTAIGAAGAVVAAATLRQYPEVAHLALHSQDNWQQWVIDEAPSTFMPPNIGKEVFNHSSLAGDTAIMAGQSLLAFWLNEKKEGVKQTLKLAAVSQIAGSVATYAVTRLGMVQGDELKKPNVGTSSMTVGLGANFLTIKSKESDKRFKKIGYAAGNIALGLGVSVGNYYLERSGATTDIAAHLAGWITGTYFGLRKKIRSAELTYDSTPETLEAAVENG